MPRGSRPKRCPVTETKRRSLRAFVVAAALLLELGSAVAAEKIDPVLTAFFAKVKAAATALAGKSDDSAYSGCLGLVRSLIDMDVVARRAAGDAWGRMSAGQRGDFRAAAERRAARSCAAQNNNYSGEPPTLLGVRSGEDGDQLLATGTKQSGGSVRTAIWRIPAHGTRAVDLVVDGQSTVLSLSQQFADILDRVHGDMGAAIDTLGR